METKLTDMEQCIGCGHSEFNSDAGNYLECRRCGLTTKHSELTAFNDTLTAERRLHPDEASNGCNAGTVYADEEETLNSAWQLMQAHAWDKALDALVPAAIPSQHPLEFAVWRGICQLVPALTDKDLKRRYQHLDVLQHNLSCLNYFLPSCEGEKKYRLLKKLHQALMLLGKLEANCLTDYSDFRDSLPDTSNRRRVSALVLLAEVLESQGADAGHGTEYLKMSVQLYHQCLITAREICNIDSQVGTFISMPVDKLQISPETRRQINEKINLLNENILQKDPKFTPQEKAPDPHNMPRWMCWFAIAGWAVPMLLFPVPYFVKDAFDAWGLGSHLPANEGQLLHEFIILCEIIWLAYIICVNVKYGCTSYKAYFDGLVEKQNKPANPQPSSPR